MGKNTRRPTKSEVRRKKQEKKVEQQEQKGSMIPLYVVFLLIGALPIGYLVYDYYQSNLPYEPYEKLRPKIVEASTKDNAKPPESREVDYIVKSIEDDELIKKIEAAETLADAVVEIYKEFVPDFTAKELKDFFYSHIDNLESMKFENGTVTFRNANLVSKLQLAQSYAHEDMKIKYEEDVKNPNPFLLPLVIRGVEKKIKAIKEGRGDEVPNAVANCTTLPLIGFFMLRYAGLPVAPFKVPTHYGLRHDDGTKDGRVNVEFTALEYVGVGKNYSDKAYKDRFNVTDEHIDSGAYLENLTKRQILGMLFFNRAQYKEALYEQANKGRRLGGKVSRPTLKDWKRVIYFDRKNIPAIAFFQRAYGAGRNYSQRMTQYRLTKYKEALGEKPSGIRPPPDTRPQEIAELTRKTKERQRKHMERLGIKLPQHPTQHQPYVPKPIVPNIPNNPHYRPRTP